MLKRFFSVFLVIILFIAGLWCFDRIYYRDRVPFLCPIELNGQEFRVRSDSYGSGYFGAKRNNGRRHKGLDILSPVGTPVRAAKSGWAFAGEHPEGYGKYVEIFHPDGLSSVYAHLDEIKIGRIKRVRQGDIIGTAGKTGNARYKGIKPHLHFEVRKDNIPQDPLKGYLKK